jgi:hypothetical protein
VTEALLVLTCLQDNAGGVYLVSTANTHVAAKHPVYDVSHLPGTDGLAAITGSGEACGPYSYGNSTVGWG